MDPMCRRLNSASCLIWLIQGRGCWLTLHIFIRLFYRLFFVIWKCPTQKIWEQPLIDSEFPSHREEMHTYIYARICINIYRYLYFYLNIYIINVNENNKEKAQGISPIRWDKTKEPVNCSQIRKINFQVSFRQMRQVIKSSPCPQPEEASSCFWENGTVQMGLYVPPHPFISGVDGGRCSSAGAQNSLTALSGLTE